MMREVLRWVAFVSLAVAFGGALWVGGDARERRNIEAGAVIAVALAIVCAAEQFR